MKNIFLFIILSLLISLTAFGQEERLFDEVEWTTVDMDSLKIEHPINWQVRMNDESPTRFLILSPKTAVDDKFRENINLTVQNLGAVNIDLDKYVEISKGQVDQLPEGKIIEEERIEKSGLPCHKMIYSGKQGDLYLTFTHYMWVIDNESFVLTFTAHSPVYEEYKTVGKKIMDSIEFVEEEKDEN